MEETAGWVLGLAWETIEDEILAEIALEREKVAGSSRISHEELWK